MSESREWSHEAAITSRRRFLTRGGSVAMVAAGSFLMSRTAWAQDAATPQPATAPGGEQMTSDSYKPVVRPAKSNAVKQMDEKQLEAFERNLACPCPCTLDIYTCRTTDFNCGISPAVHGDIQRLVDGGHSADEIMAAMTQTYGALLRGWRRNADVAATKRASEPTPIDSSIDATPDELARLQAALREER